MLSLLSFKEGRNTTFLYIANEIPFRIEKSLNNTIPRFLIIFLVENLKAPKYVKEHEKVSLFLLPGRFNVLAYFSQLYSVMFYIVDDICKKLCFTLFPSYI